jgi:ankyrin repeat protein
MARRPLLLTAGPVALVIATGTVGLLLWRASQARIHAASPGAAGPVSGLQHAGEPQAKSLEEGSLQERWRYPLAAEPDSRGSVASADVDRDGRAEVIVCTGRGAVVLDQAGRKVRALPIDPEEPLLTVGKTPHGPLLIAFDVWGDAASAYDCKGRRLWRYRAGDAVDWACAVDTGLPEGDAVAIGHNGDGGVRLVGADGRLRWHARGPANVWNVAAARLSRGGKSSVLCVHSGGTILAFDAEGKRVREMKADAGAVCGADLDGDGVDEVLGVGTTRASGNYLWAFDAGGALRWRRYVQRRYAFVDGPLTSGRFWPSGRQAAVGVCDGTIYLFSADGTPLPGVKAGPDLLSLCALPRGPEAPDALMAVASEGVVCYEWKGHRPAGALILPGPDPQHQNHPDSPLAQAVRRNDLQAVTRLLAAGADPNTRNWQGSPVLSVAIYRGYSGLARALLDAGADPNARRKDGTTALMDAVGKEDAGMVTALLARGAEPNAKTGDGDTALLHAAMFSRTPIVRALLEKGADVKAQDHMGRTALKWAANEGSVEIVRLLLAGGAPVDARDWFGSTPLMEAAREGHLEVVKLLVESGADPNAREDMTRRRYLGAQFFGDRTTTARIEKSGKLHQPRQDGPSVLAWARMGGHSDVAAFLKQAGAKE